MSSENGIYVGSPTSAFPGSPLSAGSPTMSFNEFREEYLRNRETFQSLFAERQKSTSASPRASSPSPASPTAPPAPPPRRRQLWLRVQRWGLAGMRMAQQHFSLVDVARSLFQVLLATLVLFQTVSVRGYAILLSVYVAYKLLCVIAFHAYYHFTPANDEGQHSPSLLASFIRRLSPPAPTQVQPERADPAERQEVSRQPENPSEFVAPPSLPTAEQTAPPRPPRHLVLLYVIYMCVEAFIMSLSPMFSLEAFEGSLRADGILQFT